MSEGGGMADAQDLKSFELKAREGSTPSPRNSSIIDNIGIPEYENFAITGTWLGIERSLFPQFTSKRHLMERNQLSPAEDCKTVGTNAIYRKPLYYTSSIQLRRGLMAIFAEDGITLTQGKGVIKLQRSDIYHLIQLEKELTDYNSMNEASRLDNKASKLEYLREAVKKLEAQK